jgi:hypothetical protein
VEIDHLARVAVRLGEILGTDCMLVGGLAASAWGHVRATQDVDFVTRVDPKEVQRRLAEAGIDADLRRGDVLAGDVPWVVHGALQGIAFDVFPATIAVNWQRGREVSLFEGGVLRIIDLTDLLRMKLVAGGPRDLWDVAALVKQHPEHLDTVRAAARSSGVEAKLEEWLNDPRLR